MTQSDQLLHTFKMLQEEFLELQTDYNPHIRYNTYTTKDDTYRATIAQIQTSNVLQEVTLVQHITSGAYIKLTETKETLNDLF